MLNPETKKYKLTNFFSMFFDNFGKMFICNLLFDIPLIIFSGIIILISYLLGSINIFISFLLIPLMSPFFSGLTYICGKLITKANFHPAKDFLKGIRENLLYSVINGIIAYIVSAGMWLTFNFYRDNSQNPMTITFFVISIIFLIYFLFMEFLIPTMIVSVELKFIEIIKNSVILTLAGFINNIKTLISLMLVFSVLFTIFNLIENVILSIIIIGLLIILLLPIFCAYIITFNSYPTIEKMVIKPYKEKHFEENKQKNENVVYDIDIDELRELAQGDPNEFVFLNGRMFKRNTIKNMLEKRIKKE